MTGEFWELRFIHLKVPKVEKRCPGNVNAREVAGSQPPCWLLHVLPCIQNLLSSGYDPVDGKPYAAEFEA